MFWCWLLWLTVDGCFWPLCSAWDWVTFSLVTLQWGWIWKAFMPEPLKLSAHRLVNKNVPKPELVEMVGDFYFQINKKKYIWMNLKIIFNCSQKNSALSKRSTTIEWIRNRFIKSLSRKPNDAWNRTWKKPNHNSYQWRKYRWKLQLPFVIIPCLIWRECWYWYRKQCRMIFCQIKTKQIIFEILMRVVMMWSIIVIFRHFPTK